MIEKFDEINKKNIHEFITIKKNHHVKRKKIYFLVMIKQIIKKLFLKI